MAVGLKVPAEDGIDWVRIVFVRDAAGISVILLPVSHLLNMNQLWKITERKQFALCRDEVFDLLKDRHARSPEGMTKLLSELPIIIDEGLSAKPNLDLVELCSGVRLQWQLSDEVRVCRIAARLAPKKKEALTSDQEEVAITQAVERFTARRMQKRLEDTLGLPALAPTTRKIIMLRSNPDATIDDLVPVVKLDPSLSAQVMSWAASPYYAAPGKIQSINEAIIRVLGFDLVVNLALGIAMGRTLHIPKDTPRDSTPYWSQAVCTATLAEMLARKTPIDIRPQVGLVYLSGLLHNFGYLVLAHLFPPQFSLLSRFIEANPHIEPTLIEMQALGVSRDQIGGWLLESWNLPAEVCDSIRQQGMQEVNTVEPAYPQLIRLATQLLRREGLSDGPVYPVDETLIKALGLTREVVETCVEELTGSQEALDGLTQMLYQEAH